MTLAPILVVKRPRTLNGSVCRRGERSVDRDVAVAHDGQRVFPGNDDILGREATDDKHLRIAEVDSLCTRGGSDSAQYSGMP